MRTAVWLRPELVCRLRFTEWTLLSGFQGCDLSFVDFTLLLFQALRSEDAGRQ
jgi:hypothetical protein